MSEMSLNFRLNIDDLIKFNKVALRRSNNIITVMFLVLFGYMIIANISSGYIPYTLIGVIILGALFILFRPLITKKTVEKTFKNYFAFKTNIVIDFYNDHIVERNEGGETGISFEEHFPLEAIRSISETKEHYMFLISPVEALIIPKRSMSEEDTVKMNNLIQNVFIGRYEKRN